jgi:hypothetical protein
MDQPDRPLDVPCLRSEPVEMFTQNLCHDQVAIDLYKLIFPLSTKIDD